jgi:hypothetical protein
MPPYSPVETDMPFSLYQAVLITVYSRAVICKPTGQENARPR